MLESIKELITYWDYEMWLKLHVAWRNDVLDALMPYARNQWTWAPLYLFLLIFIPGNFRTKGWVWCLFFLITFALTDLISSSLIKPYIHRVRPCNSIYLIGLAKAIVPCGSGFSFPSSHAANHFGLGVFAAITLQKRIKGVWVMGLSWAILVAYAQVYVGVHYPMDVICGGVLGSAIGTLTARIFNSRYSLSFPPVTSS